MAIIKPFKGIRPPKNLVEKVESRPYDVLDSEEARAEAGDNEMSLYHIIKPEIDFPVGTSEYDPRVYEKAAANFQKFQDKGWLVQDEKEMYYIYAQTMNGKTQYGLVIGAYVDDYMTGVIKKHELTRRDKEEDRMKHVRVNNANIEPVFFAYPDNATLEALVKKYTVKEPEYKFIAPIDGFGHQFWLIDNDSDIKTVTEEFGKMKALYIADGHHRSAAAALVGDEKRKQNPNHKGDEEYNYFMAVAFPASQLTILDYNRVIKDLNGMSSEQFLEALSKNFTVEKKGEAEYKPRAPRVLPLLRQELVQLEGKEGHLQRPRSYRRIGCGYLQPFDPRRDPWHQGPSFRQAHRLRRRSPRIEGAQETCGQWRDAHRIGIVSSLYATNHGYRG